MIYTRFYTPVKLLTAELVHEQMKYGPRKGDWLSVYYVTAEQCAPHPDEPQHAERDVGRPILDGNQFNANELKADEGWGEIMDAVHALLPELVDA